MLSRLSRVPQYVDTWIADYSWSAGLFTISGDEGRVSTPAEGLWRRVFPDQRGVQRGDPGRHGDLAGGKHEFDS